MTPQIRVCAGVITHNPDIDSLLELLGILEEESDMTVVIDNDSSNRQDLKKKLNDYKDVSIILNDENEGVASAVNQLIRYAEANRYDYILPFDQDSIPRKGIKNELLRGFRSQGDNEHLVAAAGPSRIDPRSDTKEPFIKFKLPFNQRLWGSRNADLIECDFLITSGCMMSVEALGRIGLMEDSLFIDNIDLEWSFRAKEKGYRLVGVPAAVMEHCIGEKVTHIPFLNLNIRWHSPSRTYYMVRNRILMYQRKYIPAAWKIHDSARFLIKLALLFSIGSYSREHLKNFLLGCKDAIKKSK
jgi:rhamnosyltransferase